MKAVVIQEPGKVVIRDLPEPVPGPGEALIRVRYVGFCGTGLAAYRGSNPLVTYPRIPGHEISGVIEIPGEGAPENLSAGDAVTVIPYTHCGNCPACRRGRHNACRSNQTLGVQRDGAMQEYITVPWEKILKAPTLGPLELAMVEPLTIGFHAVGRGRVICRDTVMVLGCGMIGAGAVVRASSLGARVIAVDIDDHKLELAAKLGATHRIHATQAILHEELGRITGGDGPDVVIEAAGSPETYRSAVEEVAFTGRVVCIGYAGSEVSFATRFFVQKELDILGSRNATPEDFLNVIAYLEQRTFPLDEVITAKISPDEVPDALGSWSADPGRVMKLVLDLTKKY
jgi:threonine dehydrogenase-like Zn-dependent dehydrogenase